MPRRSGSTHWRAAYPALLDQVRDMIENQKLTQDQVAAALGKNRTTIRVPRWTEDGKARIALAVRKAAAIHRKSKSDEDLRILSTDRPPS